MLSESFLTTLEKLFQIEGMAYGQNFDQWNRNLMCKAIAQYLLG